MADFRMGVVGLGHCGRAMFQWVAKGIDGVKAVAACDLNADLFYKDVHFYYGGHKPPLADEMPDVRFYDQYDEMLDQEELDIIMVETPATCHAEFCAKALEKGIHVYSDIPSVASLSEAKMLWEVQSASTAMLMTGATTCGWGFVLAMQDLARQGLIGK
ncbi:MAG: Gfo/Idh/MocA family oxidoreductase, partial [Lentisphaerae bacterium]|nr:Gfo/Idh/MocA family oxidoreductase [Lentisphaerota bacterium]